MIRTHGKREASGAGAGMPPGIWESLARFGGRRLVIPRRIGMLPGEMSMIDRMERRFGWLAFPGFLRYYGLFHVMVFVLQLFRPDIGEVLAFDRAKILSGEVWRVATMFFAHSEFGTPSLFTILLLVFAINFLFMVSDGLEEAWGSFKASLFFYMNIAGVLLASFLYPFSVPMAGTTLYASSFLAFATLFPKVEILLFLVLPVQVRFLGMLAGAGLVLTLVSNPTLFPLFLAAFANYLIFVAIPTLRGQARVVQSVQRKRRFNAAKAPASDAFHSCKVCDRTDVSNPALEFRIGTDGQEYCTEHLPE